MIYSGNFQSIVGLPSHSTVFILRFITAAIPRSTCSFLALLNLHELYVLSNSRSVILDSLPFPLNTVGDVFGYFR